MLCPHSDPCEAPHRAKICSLKLFLFETRFVHDWARVGQHMFKGRTRCTERRKISVVYVRLVRFLPTPPILNPSVHKRIFLLRLLIHSEQMHLCHTDELENPCTDLVLKSFTCFTERFSAYCRISELTMPHIQAVTHECVAWLKNRAWVVNFDMKALPISKICVGDRSFLAKRNRARNQD